MSIIQILLDGRFAFLDWRKALCQSPETILKVGISTACLRAFTWKQKKDRLFPKRSPCAGSGTRTHTHEAQDPKSCLSTNFNIPARKCKDRNFWIKNDVAILA